MNRDELRAALGATFTKASQHISAFLKTKAMDTAFQHDELRSLMAFHPGRKVQNFLHFCKRSVPPYYRPCLTVSMADRSSQVVSWTKCLQRLYEIENPERAKKLRVVQAFRDAICDSPAMLEAREKYDVGRCEGCEKRVKLHIDHDEKPFAQLLDEFLALKDLQMLKVTINFQTRPYSLLSRRLASEWVKYHDENATLVGLCKSCNSSKGSSGYRYKSG